MLLEGGFIWSFMNCHNKNRCEYEFRQEVLVQIMQSSELTNSCMLTLGTAASSAKLLSGYIFDDVIVTLICVRDRFPGVFTNSNLAITPFLSYATIGGMSAQAKKSFARLRCIACWLSLHLPMHSKEP